MQTPNIDFLLKMIKSHLDGEIDSITYLYDNLSEEEFREKISKEYRYIKYPHKNHQIKYME